MMHQFDIEVARLYGINAAILLNNIAFWVVKNETNEENYHDGYYWTFNSVAAFNSLFPYLTEKQIWTALDKLKSEGLILAGNYNNDRRDRTAWYTLTEKGRCICHVGKMHFTWRENANSPEGKSYNSNNNIYNNTPDINTDINNPPISPKGGLPPAVEKAAKPQQPVNKSVPAEGFDEFWKAYPRKDSKKVARQKWDKIRPDEETRKKILADIERRKRSTEWLKDNGQFIPMPSTYLNQQRWDDEGVTLSEPEAKYNFIN